MPTLQKVYTLEVTPERFLNACSPIELMEVELLLSSNRYQRVISDYKLLEERRFKQIQKELKQIGLWKD